eukprot:Skav217672  [mRNA]  locus=scaffold2919:300420:302213:+ [translate_table: standard]
MLVLQGYQEDYQEGYQDTYQGEPYQVPQRPGLQPQKTEVPRAQGSVPQIGSQTLKLQELLRFGNEANREANRRNAENIRENAKDAKEIQISNAQIQRTTEIQCNDSVDPFAENDDANEILTVAIANLSGLSASQVVCCIYGVAKLCDSEKDMSFQPQDPRIKVILRSLSSRAQEVTAPRLMMRVLWALGKLSGGQGLQGGDEVENIIAHFGASAPKRLAQFSPQELSNMLWGLARINDGNKVLSKDSVLLAHAVMREGTTRLQSFSTQCLTNSLWAVAKLGLRGREVAVFAHNCILHIHSVLFKEMSPQGLANSVWACAKIQCESPILDNEVVTSFALDAARRATSSEDLLTLFFPQELSMALWGIAKLMGRRRHHGEDEVVRFAMAVARESRFRIQEFSAQGVSIVAWALATLNLVENPDALEFFEVAAEVAAKDIQQYPPQAIANLCWAFNRVPGKSGSKSSILLSFGRAAALEAQQRMNEFSWQDSSGIVSALMNLGESIEVRNLAILLVQSASSQCHRIGTQALLNIALSAVRLKLDLAVVTPLANGIAEAFLKRQGLNDIDLRQWQEVQRYCGWSTGLLGRKGKKTKKKCKE